VRRPAETGLPGELVAGVGQGASAAQKPSTLPECPVSGVNIEKVSLPDGSRFFSQGRVDFVARGVPFKIVTS
jgi:hypothetical protein